jgi:NAD(P)-dependent dehydrogenase (short-subunit alcohol dehydrogenase family)
VNSLHPGGVDTDMARGQTDAEGLLATFPELSGSFSTILPVNMMPPEEISNAVLFLASDESRYVTGSEMTVDAGCTAL